jgi:hypothetical protein
MVKNSRAKRAKTVTYEIRIPAEGTRWSLSFYNGRDEAPGGRDGNVTAALFQGI